MKKEEAEKKWCPFARVVYTTSYDECGSANRTEDDNPMCFCITDRCMAWDDEAEKKYDTNGNPVLSGHCRLMMK